MQKLDENPYKKCSKEITKGDNHIGSNKKSSIVITVLVEINNLSFTKNYFVFWVYQYNFRGWFRSSIQ